MNDVEVKRLAHAINELRPGWPISSLTTFISRNLSNKHYRDAAVALVWVALDADNAGNPVTQTPKRVLEPGPWWKAAENSGSMDGHRAHAPKVTELCTVPGHEGYRANPCAGCHSDRLAGDEPPARAPRADATAGAAMVRATMGGA